VRNLALLRCRVHNLVAPLACIVDYYGLRFEAMSLMPLSINSLVYGSDTDGLLFTDSDQEAERIAEQVSKLVNIKPHFIQERATGLVKQIHLPYTVQLHRSKDYQADPKVYLVNALRLMPADESLRKQQLAPPLYEIVAK